jgi:pantoate--beta-alanine ligase
VLAAARAVLGRGAADGPALTVDYLSLVDPETFTPVGDGYAGPAVLAVAARAGGTRLIDNVALTLPEEG